MPFFHWETDRRKLSVVFPLLPWKCHADSNLEGRARAAKVVRKATKPSAKLTSMSEVALLAGGIPRTNTGGQLEIIPKALSDRPINRRNITPLGRLLLYAAELKEQMDFDTDEKLLKEYIHADPPLHPRRTLDQAYYWTLSSTEKRDRDQVSFRSAISLAIYYYGPDLTSIR
jgi:hypothetical protein